jgi:DNA-binding HxlR family transcriptional regulator
MKSSSHAELAKFTKRNPLLGLTFLSSPNIIKPMDADKKVRSGNSLEKRRENPVTGCPLTAALAAVGGKWKLIIIYWLAQSPKHFAGLKREMSSISQKVLTEQLRELESDGIIIRKPTGAVPAPVEYSLTDYGLSVLPLVETVRLWGRGHLEHLSTGESSDAAGAAG